VANNPFDRDTILWYTVLQMRIVERRRVAMERG